MSGLAARQLSLPPLPLEEPSENEPSENAGVGVLLDDQREKLALACGNVYHKECVDCYAAPSMRARMLEVRSLKMRLHHYLHQQIVQ